MTKTIPDTNELVSFAVMILMAIALVAGEADATVHEAARAAAAATADGASERTNVPFSTTINTRIAGQPLTISIDAVAEFSLASFDAQ
ncbi:MAG: hypothetical protein HKN64_05290 [Woeseiaceae bacterium]|nr:hypothetical protein [Woeseiaceae bacterium]